MKIESYFLGELQCRFPGDNDRVIDLTEHLRFRDSDGSWATARRGLRTDGASVGRLLKIPVLGFLVRLVMRGDQFTGPFRLASVIHDGGPYGDPHDLTAWAAFRSPRRKKLDQKMRSAALCRRVVIRRTKTPPGCSVFDCIAREPAPRWAAWVVYWVLRVAGWVAWAENSAAMRAAR